MEKLENPYIEVLDNIKDSLSLHKIESSRIAKDVITNKLEEKVKKYVNDPRVSEIKSQKKISEDDQGYLDINIFVSTFYKNKLDISKNYDKEYKKFLILADQYKNLLQERINQLELNASLLSKFTDEEIVKNPKLSKMLNVAPEGLNDIKKKFIILDAALSNIYADYISKNGEEYSTRLYEFLSESKQFRKQFRAKKQLEIEELKEKPVLVQSSNVENTQASQNINDLKEIKQLLQNNETILNEDLAEIKVHISKILTPVQLGEFNSFEESIRNDYINSITTDSLITKRLDNSLNQFQKGVDKISDLIVETGNTTALQSAISVLANELFETPLKNVKNDSAYINLLIGYCCGIKKFLSENDDKKGLFRKVDTGILGIKKIHSDMVNYLINSIGVEETLLGNNMLGTMITKDKLGELAYVLMNNATRISNVSDISNWEEEVNKIVVLCISEMVTLLEQGKAPIQAIIKYKDQYLNKSSNEAKNDEEQTQRKRKHIDVSQDDQVSKIKRILQ